jgi:hypothetical protein
MNSDNPMNLLKKGFHVTLGATSSLVESLQDPIKREENLAQLRGNPSDFAEVLAERGAVAEVEARKLVDSVVAQYAPSAVSTSTPSPASAMSHPPSIDPNLQIELKEFTKQLAELRQQLNLKSML